MKIVVSAAAVWGVALSLATAAVVGVGQLGPAASVEPAEAAFREGIRLRGTPEEPAAFRQAAARLEALRRSGADSPALFLHLGNAYLLAGDVARAILAYHAGLRRAPADPDLPANLAYAREQIVYAAGESLGRPSPDYWPLWLPRPARTAWLVAALVLYTLSCIGLTRWVMTRQRWLLIAGVFILYAALQVGINVMRWDSGRAADAPLVVIAEDNVILRKGNGLSYPPRYEQPVNRGVEARLRYERGDWLQIELAGGEVGWVPRAVALVDYP